MDREQVWREFEALPPLAQQQVADFIAFLRARVNHATNKSTSSLDFVNEPFIGMWQDREDLADSSAWVRQLREREWSRTHT
jgi:hypothetical protein